MNVWTLFIIVCVALFVAGLAFYKFLPNDKK